MKNIYNDLLSAYCEMKNQKMSICNDINNLIAKSEQLVQDMDRIEYILGKYGTYKSAGFIENKAESEG